MIIDQWLDQRKTQFCCIHTNSSISVITYTIAHTCIVSMHVCYKVIAQDESALPLTSIGPRSTNLSTAQWNGLRGGMVMHVQ